MANPRTLDPDLWSCLFHWMESPVSLGTQLRSPVIAATSSHILKGFTPAVRHPFSNIIFFLHGITAMRIQKYVKSSHGTEFTPYFWFPSVPPERRVCHLHPWPHCT